MGLKANYPIEIQVDNAAGISFQQSTTPNSRIKGAYDLRDNWVIELKDKGKIKASAPPSDGPNNHHRSHEGEEGGAVSGRAGAAPPSVHHFGNPNGLNLKELTNGYYDDSSPRVR